MAEDDGFVRITLRIPSDLHGRLNEAAAKKRSMNAEIIHRLEASFSAGRSRPTDWKESDAIAHFASSLMQAMHYGKEIGRMVKVEVNVSDDLKPEPEPD